MRLLLTPKWLVGHLVVLMLFAACLFLGWWQLGRFESSTGGPQNLAYALQWPLFAVFGLWFWRRVLRDALAAGDRPAPKRVVQPRPAEEYRAVIKAQEAQDPALAAYNRYLASLHAKDA